MVRRSFGGRDALRTGLGYAVRGIDSGALDTNPKLVHNLELRMNLPAIVLPDIVPGVLVHWDAGYFAQVGESVATPLSGFVSTIGAGVYVNLLDLATLSAYLHYRLDGVNADGSSWCPSTCSSGCTTRAARQVRGRAASRYEVAVIDRRGILSAGNGRPGLVPPICRSTPLPASPAGAFCRSSTCFHCCWSTTGASAATSNYPRGSFTSPS